MAEYHESYVNTEQPDLTYHCPEQPKRIMKIKEYLQENKLLDYFAQIDLPEQLTENVCLEIEKSVKLCHSQKYIDEVKQKC